MPSTLILPMILQELVSQYVSLIFSSLSATWPLQDKYNKYLRTHSVSTAYSCTVPLKCQQNNNNIARISPSVSWVQGQTEPSFATRDWFLHTYLSVLSEGGKRRGKLHICHKRGETWRWVGSLLYEHQSSQCCSREIGQEEIQVPEALQIPNPMTSTCAGLYMCVSEIRTDTTDSTLAFFPCLMFKSWFFQPLFLSDGFGNGAPSQYSVQQVLFNQHPDFQMWLGFQKKYWLWEFGRYTLHMEIRKYLLWSLFKLFLLKEVAHFSRNCMVT